MPENTSSVFRWLIGCAFFALGIWMLTKYITSAALLILLSMFILPISRTIAHNITGLSINYAVRFAIVIPLLFSSTTSYGANTEGLWDEEQKRQQKAIEDERASSLRIFSENRGKIIADAKSLIADENYADVVRLAIKYRAANDDELNKLKILAQEKADIRDGIDRKGDERKKTEEPKRQHISASSTASALEFDEIRDALEEPGLTSVQKKKIIKSYIGKEISWKGWVFDVEEHGRYFVCKIDMDPPDTIFSLSEIWIKVNESMASSLSVGEEIRISGSIRNIDDTISIRVYLKNPKLTRSGM